MELEEGHRPHELGFRPGELGIHGPLCREAVERRVRFFERQANEREVGLQLRHREHRLGDSAIRPRDGCWDDAHGQDVDARSHGRGNAHERELEPHPPPRAGSLPPIQVDAVRWTRPSRTIGVTPPLA